MNNKKMGSLIFNVGLSFALVIVTLFVFMSFHFGWFASNETVSANGMNISVDHDDTVATYYIYQYDTVTEKGSTSTTGQGGSTTPNTIANLNMSSYDTIFHERNKYNPVVIRIEISGTKVSETGTITVYLDRLVSLPNNGATPPSLALDGENDSKFGYFSSCIHFKALTTAESKLLNDHLGEDNADDLIWTHTTQGLADNPETEANEAAPAIVDITSNTGTTSFTSITSGTVEGDQGSRTYAKQAQLAFVITYGADNWVGTGDNRKLNVYLYLNYDEDLVSCAFSDSGMSLDNSDSLAQISLDLLDDLVRISAKHS